MYVFMLEERKRVTESKLNNEGNSKGTDHNKTRINVKKYKHVMHYKHDDFTMLNGKD